MSTTLRSAEMNPGPGFRISLHSPRLPEVLVNEFHKFPTPDISDQLNRLYAVDASIRCLTGTHHRLCGQACTVKVFPGDNLMVHKSLDVARPGDIIVIDGRGSMSNAVLGDLVCTKAKHRGIAGFVVDGLIRDLPGILPLEIPVFARGATPIGPLHRGPGEVNHPIVCGGVVVHPGDIMVGDGAGIVVVPADAACELLRRLKGHEAANTAYLAAVQRGEFSNEWVDRLLAKHECLVTGEPRQLAINKHSDHVNAHRSGFINVAHVAPEPELS
ncbi:MAG: RraA family protein [Pirellulales bacterium]